MRKEYLKDLIMQNETKSLLSHQKVVPSVKNDQISWENKYIFHWGTTSWVISFWDILHEEISTKGSLCGIAFVMMCIYVVHGVIQNPFPVLGMFPLALQDLPLWLRELLRLMSNNL